MINGIRCSFVKRFVVLYFFIDILFKFIEMLIRYYVKNVLKIDIKI